MITLASKRYTLLAYGTTLDSRYPSGGGAGLSPVTWFAWNADATTVQTPIVTGSVNDATNTTLGVSDSGRTCMRLNIPGGTQAQQGLQPGAVTLGSAFGQTLYYRWWMRIDPSFSWGSADAKIKANRVGNTGGTAEFHTMYLHKDKVQLSPIVESNDYPTCVYDFKPSTNSAVTSWHEYIIELKQMSSLDAGDGHMKLYIDGVKVAEHLSVNFYGAEASGTWSERWGAFMVRPYRQLNDGAAGGYIYVDDFSLTNFFYSTV